MPLSANPYPLSLVPQRHLEETGRMLARTVERLSSGLRINGARDDPAGLAIAERLLAQSRSMDVAVRNANEAISMAQVADGALSTVTQALQDMRDLALQSANGTLDSADRDLLQAEYAELEAEVTRLVNGTAYLDIALLDNTSTSTFQVGARAEDTIDVTHTDLSSIVGALGSVDGADASNATAAVDLIDTALDTTATAQSAWGATLNRFDLVVSGLNDGAIRTAAARSRIVDADYATEVAEQSRLLILQQSAVAMLTQANAQPRLVLTLLGL
ncbi:MAG: flagellin [Rubrivivax sp.]